MSHGQKRKERRESVPSFSGSPRQGNFSTPIVERRIKCAHVCVFVCACTGVCVNLIQTHKTSMSTLFSLLKLTFGLSPQVRSAVQRHSNCTVLFFCRDFTHARSSSFFLFFKII